MRGEHATILLDYLMLLLVWTGQLLAAAVHQLFVASCDNLSLALLLLQPEIRMLLKELHVSGSAAPA